MATKTSLSDVLKKLRQLHERVFFPERLDPQYPQELGPLCYPGMTREQGYEPRKGFVSGTFTTVGTTNHTEPLFYVSGYLRNAAAWAEYLVELVNAVHKHKLLDVTRVINREAFLSACRYGGVDPVAELPKFFDVLRACGYSFTGDAAPNTLEENQKGPSA